MTPAIHFLKQHQLPFHIHRYHHDPNELHYGEEAVKHLGVSAEVVYKTLIVRQTPSLALAVAVIPVAMHLDLKKLAKCLASKKVSLAEPALAEKITGYRVGGISPIAQKKPLITIIAAAAQYQPTIYISAGQRGLDIALDPHLLCQIVQGKFADITQ